MLRRYEDKRKLVEKEVYQVESSYGVSIFGIFPVIIVIFNGLFKMLAIYSLYLFIKLAIRGIQALDIYLEEKRGRL